VLGEVIAYASHKIDALLSKVISVIIEERISRRRIKQVAD